MPLLSYLHIRPVQQFLKITAQYTPKCPNAHQSCFYQLKEALWEREELSSSQPHQSDLLISSGTGLMEEAHFCLTAVCSD